MVCECRGVFRKKIHTTTWKQADLCTGCICRGVHMSAATSPNSSQWTFRDKTKKCCMLSYVCLATFDGPFYIKEILLPSVRGLFFSLYPSTPLIRIPKVWHPSQSQLLQCLEKGGPFKSMSLSPVSSRTKYAFSNGSLHLTAWTRSSGTLGYWSHVGHMYSGSRCCSRRSGRV